MKWLRERYNDLVYGEWIVYEPDDHGGKKEIKRVAVLEVVLKIIVIINIIILLFK